MIEAADSQPIHQFTTRRTIEFADTDMAGIVHFARFFVFMETAEHELLRSLGTEVHARHLDAQGKELQIGWPRVATGCDYRRPLRFADQVEIRVRLEKKGTSSLTFAHTFLKDGEVMARGRMTSVCCDMKAPGGLKAVPIPPAIADRLTEAPPDEGGETAG